MMCFIAGEIFDCNRPTHFYTRNLVMGAILKVSYLVS